MLITAETPSSDPVNLAGADRARSRDRCRVGTVGMDIERKAYYEKELDFRISRSYGPGRYDAAYEQKGRDYPIGYVRWTETRNMEAFLQLLAEKKTRCRLADHAPLSDRACAERLRLDHRQIARAIPGSGDSVCSTGATIRRLSRSCLSARRGPLGARSNATLPSACWVPEALPHRLSFRR